MPRLTVIVTEQTAEKLAQLVEGLNQSPEYSPGLKVSKDSSLIGKYRIKGQNGAEQIVRIIDRWILAGGAVRMMEEMLIESEIAFKEYRLDIRDPNSSMLGRELKLPPPEQADAVYNP